MALGVRDPEGSRMRESYDGSVVRRVNGLHGVATRKQMHNANITSSTNSSSGSSKRRPRMRKPHRALAWVLAIATIALCLAAGPRIRARSIRRASEAASAGLFKRDAEEGGPPDVSTWCAAI
jgi:hypothetical protein